MTNKKRDKKGDKRKQKGDKADTVTHKKGAGDKGRQLQGRGGQDDQQEEKQEGKQKEGRQGGHSH